jgi:hypothetical protein
LDHSRQELLQWCDVALLLLGNGVHPASKVGEHSHPQTAQDVLQAQLAKNPISNGPHEKGQWGQICPFDNWSRRAVTKACISGLFGARFQNLRMPCAAAA